MVKNLWSLNIDEALVAGEIKNNFNKKNYEVFFPINAQLKDIDLLFLNLKNKKVRTIQVKGSRTYEPNKRQREKYGRGSGAWITISKKVIFNPTNKVDFYILVLHSIVDGDQKKNIKINHLIIPSSYMTRIAKKKVLRKGNKYHFFIWIDPNGKRSFDFNQKGEIHLSKYLDKWDLLKK